MRDALAGWLLLFRGGSHLHGVGLRRCHGRRARGGGCRRPGRWSRGRPCRLPCRSRSRRDGCHPACRGRCRSRLRRDGRRPARRGQCRSRLRRGSSRRRRPRCDGRQRDRGGLGRKRRGRVLRKGGGGVVEFLASVGSTTQRNPTAQTAYTARQAPTTGRMDDRRRCKMPTRTSYPHERAPTGSQPLVAGTGRLVQVGLKFTSLHPRPPLLPQRHPPDRRTPALPWAARGQAW